MENLAEEYIKALQTSIEYKKRELKETGYWNPFKRNSIKGDIHLMEQRLGVLLKQAQGIRQ